MWPVCLLWLFSGHLYRGRVIGSPRTSYESHQRGLQESQGECLIPQEWGNARRTISVGCTPLECDEGTPEGLSVGCTPVECDELYTNNTENWESSVNTWTNKSLSRFLSFLSDNKTVLMNCFSRESRLRELSSGLPEYSVCREYNNLSDTTEWYKNKTIQCTNDEQVLLYLCYTMYRTGCLRPVFLCCLTRSCCFGAPNTSTVWCILSVRPL